jgi:hypothetical protein
MARISLAIAAFLEESNVDVGFDNATEIDARGR